LLVVSAEVHQQLRSHRAVGAIVELDVAIEVEQEEVLSGTGGPCAEVESVSVVPGGLQLSLEVPRKLVGRGVSFLGDDLAIQNFSKHAWNDRFAPKEKA